MSVAGWADLMLFVLQGRARPAQCRGEFAATYGSISCRSHFITAEAFRCHTAPPIARRGFMVAALALMDRRRSSLGCLLVNSPAAGRAAIQAVGWGGKRVQ